MEGYRLLLKGEIIQEGDEADMCRDNWRDSSVWVKTKNAGKTVPDPSYPAHTLYRRKINKGV